ncbi:MAG TPA: sugar phosphate isomerase/epimerase family protein [Bryobacteraceae bacterium]|nr:sugar phosphate isomerase/epimerase family protein [Bryobacteraceae bacterium]
MTRRTFFAASAATAAMAAPTRLPIKKGVIIGMVEPRSLSYADRFKIARDAGFDVVECTTITDEKEAEEIKKASESSGIPIKSVMNMAHWKYPLSSSDPAVVAESVRGMEISLRNAHLWGADAVLLVPAVVDPQTSYQDAWTRSTAQIKKMIPLAQRLKVIIAVENVWNKFLVSPLEMANYVDQFKSPWVRSYFDVGNVALFGYSQDWIRTLGKRIVKVHLKDFKFAKRVAEFTPLREGELDWKAIHKALGEIGYNGTATVELPGGNLEYLKEVSRRVDLILNGA